MVFFPALQVPPAHTDQDPPTESTPTAGPGPSSIRTAKAAAAPSGTMPPPHGPVIRKQNIACDACRSRKIRCQRVSIHQICEQCESRGSECTSRYVELLASKQSAKSGTGGPKNKRRRKSDDAESVAAAGGSGGTPLDARVSDPTSTTKFDQAATSWSDALARPRPSPAATELSAPTSGSAKQDHLLRYLFAPGPVSDQVYGYNDLSSIRQCEAGDSDLWEEMGGRVWTEAPSKAQLDIDHDAINDLAEDLLDTYFSIVHIRLPLLDPDSFRARFSDPEGSPGGPLYHPLLAVALAWGARYSDHPVITADKEEISSRAGSSNAYSDPERSRLVQLLVIRAREVAETNKAFRTAKMENVRLAILLEPLLGQAPFLKDRYQDQWVAHATRHFIEQGLNSPSGLLAVKDDKERSEYIFIWWLMCLSDGFRSAFHRLRPATGDGYFDVDLQMQFQSTFNLGDKAAALLAQRNDTAKGAAAPSPEVEQRGHDAWLRASHDGSTTCRMICNELWLPRVKEKGIPISTLRKLLDSISGWRDTHLSKLGVPTKWPEDWDFLATITTCSTDIYCHCLWLVVAGAIRDFGVVEAKAMERGEQPPSGYEVEGVLRRCREEADHSAMRIAALAAVLTENGYLRLDTLVVYKPIYEAGLYLARQGKEECLACVAGLRQYAVPFPSIWSSAEEIELLYLTTTEKRAQSVTNGVGQLPSTLPPLSTSSASNPGSVTTSTSHSTPHDPTAQAASAPEPSPATAAAAAVDWSSQTLDFLAQGHNYPQLAQPHTDPHAQASGGIGDIRNLWPDGTPMPSRDVAWNLFDWVHQS